MALIWFGVGVWANAIPVRPANSATTSINPDRAWNPDLQYLIAISSSSSASHIAHRSDRTS